jgi:hypothetical protein
MSERDKNEQQTGGEPSSDTSGPEGQASPAENPGVTGEESINYRRAEEDATSLAEEERTGEGTGARAGEYS